MKKEFEWDKFAWGLCGVLATFIVLGIGMIVTAEGYRAWVRALNYAAVYQ